MITKQQYLGVALALTSIALGSLYLGSTIFFRLLLGLALGYVLVRGSIGFAGSVNRAYKSGSTRLMVVLMGMFVGTAVINAVLVMNAEPGTYNLWVNPINAGLILGGLLFGFGMSFSSCCATGVLARISSKMPMALITLFFFCLGVFAGFPIQKEASWITDTWVSSSSYPEQGVFLPDLMYRNFKAQVEHLSSYSFAGFS
ncbi:MAG: YeeE/YedE thiosulfate transporter family protein [Endozoicomonas sp.]|uniref:YeeE/YedE thiosulfate transporter family protein n=1 Tax=Endozoicomonas sp. TaxID=1892382 RepID=UPI003D9B3A1E